jgi:diaminohydroxyphosphoribosylaminopyrimidine deaminase / 5-amino-6-(5-phosphoribosylamino)uracil reductase
MSPLGAAEAAALARARELACNGRGRVSPNPLVGAVMLREGRLIAEGWHEGPGLPHAEIMALRAAGAQARGATQVCTLEPCSHFGRTPPCTAAVIDAGVARVVVGCLDPLEPARGSGARLLRDAGIEVALADGADERRSRELIDAFITHTVRGRPHVMLKLATSLDGKVATRTGESQWITGPEARALVHRLRADHDAVVVGIGTALADDPQLTARGLTGPVRQPVRVVFDSFARLPLDSALVRGARALPVFVAVGANAPWDRVTELQAAGVEVIAFATLRPEVPAVLAALAEREIQSVFVEGGAGLAGAFVESGAVDVVRWFLAPILVGGDQAPGALGGVGLARLADAARLHEPDVTRIGDDILCAGRLIELPRTED